MSPWHRLLICGQRAELMFGEYEVLVPCGASGRPAGQLPRETTPQTYVHLMFDEHQIISRRWRLERKLPTRREKNLGRDRGGAAAQSLLALFPELAEEKRARQAMSLRVCR